jgi:mannose-6-phosphate isomerase-like protein (cupin superfamily)
LYFKVNPLDVQKFIESGILEEYCLGSQSEEEQAFVIQMSLLYPEVKKELTALELAMESLAALKAIAPGDEVREKILHSLGLSDSDTPLDLNDLPITDETSNHQLWLNALVHLIPSAPAEDFLSEVIRQDEQVTQMLVVTKMDVPEELHDDRIESFFILKGTCVCIVGDQLFRLTAGDFLEIPLHTAHDIKIISPYVVAILQHKVV